MLKLIKLQDPGLRWSFLSHFHPQTECYVVSDVKTKMAVEEFLLKKHKSLSGSPILRMREFLKEIFKYMESPWQLVPETCLREFFSDFALSHKEILVQNSHHSKEFFPYFYHFLPLLAHPEGVPLMEEWMKAKKRDRASIWTHWWNISREFFQFVNKKKILSEEGLKRILVYDLQSLIKTPLPFKKVIFDLGVPSDKWEQEFLKELAKKQTVELIAPHFKEKDVHSILSAQNYIEESDFQEVESFTSPSSDSPQKPPKGTKLKAFLPQKKPLPLFIKNRYETSLIEVKEAVAQICRWRKQGTLENEITVLAPDMEDYWFCLKPHLEQEGISFKKGHSVALMDFPEILFWFSELRLHLGFLSFSDLETKSFYKPPAVSFSAFHSLFAKVPERELSGKLLNKKKVKNRENKITGKEFIKWGVSFWPESGREELLQEALESFQEFPLEAELKWEAWLRVLESGLFSSKKELEEESSQGISCLSLNAIHAVRGAYVFIMGLDQDSLLSSSGKLAQEDMEALSIDLGFPLSVPHPRHKELNLLWFLQSSSLKQVILSVANRNFSGTHQTPSLLWMLYEQLSTKKGELIEKSSEKLTLGENSFPTKQETPPDFASPCTEKKPIKMLLLEKRCQKKSENLIQTKAAFPEGSFQKYRNHFSATSLKRYTECPFAYAVEYVFNLRHFEKTDRELSPLDSGKISHLLLETLLKKKNFLTWTEDEISQSIDHLLDDIKRKETKSIHISQWAVIKKTLLETALRFLEEETLLFNKVPGLQILGQELKVECYWSHENKEFSKKGNILFKGRIDRLDYEPSTQSYFIRDYKNSVDQINHIDRWAEKKELQLLLYAFLVENELISGLPKGKVRVLDFYSYRDFKHKGYIEEGSPFEELFGSRWRGKKNRKVLESAFIRLKNEIYDILTSIDKREFSPQPSDKKNCERCSWRKWCRAPHLN